MITCSSRLEEIEVFSLPGTTFFQKNRGTQSYISQSFLAVVRNCAMFATDKRICSYETVLILSCYINKVVHEKHFITAPLEPN